MQKPDCERRSERGRAECAPTYLCIVNQSVNQWMIERKEAERRECRNKKGREHKHTGHWGARARREARWRGCDAEL